MRNVGNLVRFERLNTLSKTFATIPLITELYTGEYLLGAVPPMTLPHRHTVGPSHHKLH